MCEHKVASKLGDQQINRYATSFASHAGHFYTVLVTSNTLQHTQAADIRLIWADVSDFLIVLRGLFENEHGFLLEQLIQYLQSQGLARMEPLSMENILGYFPGMELCMKLEALLPKLQFMDWTTHCAGLQRINPGQLEPTFKKLRWGRIGIELFTGMTPGLFAGVMLDYHQIPSLEVHNKQLGPDVVIMLEYDYYPIPKDDWQRCIWQQRKLLLANLNYQTLCTRLQTSAFIAGFQFTKELAKSRWRIIVLQKPLAEIMQGAQSEREQLARLFDTMCQGINHITQDDLLAQAFIEGRTESPSISPS